MATLLLIRHGDNDTLGKFLAGQTPGVHLNDKGLRQAQGLVCQLAAAPIKAVYSSPLERALETARPLAQFVNQEIQIKPGLIELDYGNWVETFGQLRRYKVWKMIYEKPEEVRFPGGETFIEVQQRACAEIESIAAAHEKQDLVAVFTHADVIRLVVTHYLDMPLIGFHKFMIEPASITILALSDGKARIPKLNQTGSFIWPEPQKKRTQRAKPEEKKK